MLKRRWYRWLLTGCLLVVLGSPLLQGLQMWRRGMEEDVPIPADANEETEYYFVRLAYQNSQYSRRWGQAWMTDSPAADRHFLQGVRRLSNIHARSLEKYIRPQDPELFNHPWIYAVEVGQWYLDEQDAARLREYLLRGGFLVVDDFHGSFEWQVFYESMHRVFPDRPIVEVQATDPVFHVLYDVDRSVQIPGIQYLWSGQTFERDGVEPHWRGIYDDKGRLMVLINFNMDLGDAWEHADEPRYPEHWTALAYRFGINYIIYAMTH